MEIWAISDASTLLCQVSKEIFSMKSKWTEIPQHLADPVKVIWIVCFLGFLPTYNIHAKLVCEIKF